MILTFCSTCKYNKQNLYFQLTQPFDLKFLEREFRKFGTIESIEFLPNGKPEAYITFDNDRSAYLAIAHTALEARRCYPAFPLNIQPADTWKQPPVSNTPDNDDQNENNSPPFLILNEDCILEIANFLDFDSLLNMSRVCKLFHRLLHQHCFPRIRKFLVDNRSSEVPMPLAKMRRSLISIGQYITEFTFKWHDFDHCDRLKRFLEKLAKFVGRNVRCVRFHGAHLTEEHIAIIQNILKDLETLEIVVYNPDFELDLDWMSICPTLRKLKLLQNMQLIRICKPWPTLQHLSIVGNEYMVLNTFRSFISKNPQLTTLKFTGYHTDDRLLAVSQHLPNLRKLSVYSSFPNLSASNVVYLSGLQHLTQLNLMYLDENDLNKLLQCLSRFAGLRVLKLHLLYDGPDEGEDHFEPHQQSLIGIAQDLPHLEKFYTRYIKWKESTVIDFIRFGNHLKAMHIHWCDILFTNAIIGRIVKILQTNRPQHQTTPLELFVNPSDVVGLQMINDSELVRYLRVSTKCRHIERS